MPGQQNTLNPAEGRISPCLSSPTTLAVLVNLFFLFSLRHFQICFSFSLFFEIIKNNVDGANVRCLVASVCCSVTFFSTSIMTFNLLCSILTCLQGMVQQASMSKRYGMETGITGNNNRNRK